MAVESWSRSKYQGERLREGDRTNSESLSTTQNFCNIDCLPPLPSKRTIPLRVGCFVGIEYGRRGVGVTVNNLRAVNSLQTLLRRYCQQTKHWAQPTIASLIHNKHWRTDNQRPVVANLTYKSNLSNNFIEFRSLPATRDMVPFYCSKAAFSRLDKCVHVKWEQQAAAFHFPQ